jgi:importin subunit beta-1
VTSSPLSPFAKEIITALLHASQRPDVVASDTCRLQINVFEAINEMIRAASPDTMDTVAALIPVFLQELMKTFSMASSSAEARERQSELQGQLCGVLMVRRGRGEAGAGWALVTAAAAEVWFEVWFAWGGDAAG